jgi:hypothetical protein
MDNADRLVRMRIDVGEDGTIRSVKVEGELRLPRKMDLEGVAFDPRRRSLLVSDESPGIAEYQTGDGRLLRRIDVPEVFRRHVVPNQGFESLALSPDGKTLWTANERALAIDGNPKTDATPILVPTRVRLLRYDVREDGAITPTKQFEYVTSGVHDWGGQIGLCDLVALPDGQLLALERSGAMNFRQEKSIRTRIFLIDVARAADVSGEAFAAGLKDVRTSGQVGGQVDKLLLFDGFVCAPRGQNLEGLCLGPRLGNDRWAIIGVVDSSDGPLRLSQSRVVTFELNLSAPATQPRAPTTHKSPL